MYVGYSDKNWEMVPTAGYTVPYNISGFSFEFFVRYPHNSVRRKRPFEEKESIYVKKFYLIGLLWYLLLIYSFSHNMLSLSSMGQLLSMIS